jgi:hypothetical protein
MRYFLLCGALLLAGCQNVVGPSNREFVRVDDPRLPTAEQQWRSRAFLALPNESYLSGPQLFSPRVESSPNQYK